MSAITPTLDRVTLIDRVFARSITTDLALISAGAALTAISAQLAIPLAPVPITMQSLVVLLVGCTLGAARGAASMVLYLVVGLLGAPVFSDGASGAATILGPTGGYIIGFIFAAALTGWLAGRNWDRKFLGSAISFLAGTVVIFSFGLVGLALALSTDLARTLELGLYPFILGGLLKTAFAAALIPTTWKVIDWADKRRG